MKLTVVGAYLPRLTPGRLSDWIQADVAAYVEGMRDLKSRGLAQSTSEEEIKEIAAELPGELAEALNAAALFEVVVEDHSGNFDPYTLREKQTTSVAWEPTYLSLDGERKIAESASELTEGTSFRVAFYVHDWPEDGVLIGPTGPLDLPPFKSVPERLWTLAPYEPLD